MIHPVSKFERLKIKNKKNEQKTKSPKDKTGHIRRKLYKEHVKEIEAEDELRKARVDNLLQ